VNSNLPISASASSLFRHTLALLIGVLLSLSPVPSNGQRVTFTDAPTALPFDGLFFPIGIALDEFRPDGSMAHLLLCF
jgi:hypothetical protein